METGWDGNNTTKQIIFWETDCHSSGQQIPNIYGTRMFVTVFSIAKHRSLFWYWQIPSTASRPVCLRSVVTLYSILLLGLRSCLCAWGYTNKMLYALLIPPSRATCFASIVILQFILISYAVWVMWPDPIQNCFWNFKWFQYFVGFTGRSSTRPTFNTASWGQRNTERIRNPQCIKRDLNPLPQCPSD
jgi:hypothetical protein